MEKIFKVTSGLTKKVNDKTTLEVTFDYEDGKNWNCQKGYYVSTSFVDITDKGNGILCREYTPFTDCKTACIKTVKRKSQKALKECKTSIKSVVIHLLRMYGAKAYADTLKSSIMNEVDKAVQGL
jgi:hypothetical protein